MIYNVSTTVRLGPWVTVDLDIELGSTTFGMQVRVTSAAAAHTACSRCDLPAVCGPAIQVAPGGVFAAT